MNQRITIERIAELANTSRGTVDRVLNNRGRVAPEVEKRIRRVVEETGYRANASARATALSGKTFEIGVILGSKGNNFFDLVQNGMEAAASRLEDSNLVFLYRSVSLFDEDDVLKAIGEFKERNVSALVISAVFTPSIQYALSDYKGEIVAISLDLPIKKLCYVGPDYSNSGALAANVLSLMFGDRKGNVLAIAGSLRHPGQKERMKSFEAKLPSTLTITDIVENLDNDEVSERVVKEACLKEVPDAVYFCGAGVEGGLRALKEMSLSPVIVATDLSDGVVEGLHDGSVAAAITQHAYTQGVRVVEIVHDALIARRPVPSKKVLDNGILLKESIISHKMNN